MHMTVGYGGRPLRNKERPIFVVRSSESAAAVSDEGWSDVECGFFAAGAALEDAADRRPPAPPAPARWRWVAVAGTALVLSLSAILIAAVPGPRGAPLRSAPGPRR